MATPGNNIHRAPLVNQRLPQYGHPAHHHFAHPGPAYPRPFYAAAAAPAPPRVEPPPPAPAAETPSYYTGPWDTEKGDEGRSALGYLVDWLTMENNMLQYAKGGMSLDACRQVQQFLLSKGTNNPPSPPPYKNHKSEIESDRGGGVQALERMKNAELSLSSLQQYFYGVRHLWEEQSRMNMNSFEHPRSGQALQLIAAFRILQARKNKENYVDKGKKYPTQVQQFLLSKGTNAPPSPPPIRTTRARSRAIEAAEVLEEAEELEEGASHAPMEIQGIISQVNGLADEYINATGQGVKDDDVDFHDLVKGEFEFFWPLYDAMGRKASAKPIRLYDSAASLP
ncbi:hypothetical protein B9479_002171 [Cryptococcus floricola]|uniref:Uncharacterized protein n=1 Tax=Cryptococcus floricola TaxID=2591691 RepID=A0A5D3B4G4_9TREE|nr:hypothetical protein B9479_002171 [Cryptococcus floricola]